MKQVTIKDITVCQCCGHTFTPTKEMHYVVKETPKPCIIKLGEPGTTQYDAFDCPNCGCQIIAGERLRPVDEAIFALGDIDEVHEYDRKEEDDVQECDRGDSETDA